MDMCGLDTRQPASNSYTSSLSGFSESRRVTGYKLAHIVLGIIAMLHSNESLILILSF